MSEQGWRAFLDADGVEDWVVLHGGAAAVFEVGSLGAAALFAEAIARVLGYAPLAGDNSIDPLGHGPTIWMQDLDPAKPLRHAMHIDVSLAREEALRRLDAAVAAGGRIVSEANAPGSWILADRSGNKVC